MRTPEPDRVASMVLAIVCLVVSSPASGQPAPQNPSPMVDTTRPHPRINQSSPPGTRVPLAIGTLYLPPSFDPSRGPRLVVHFHGAAWLVEELVATHLPGTALVSVELGAGSRVYSRPFEESATFDRLLREAATAATPPGGRPIEWAGIHLSSFSAGYGAVRAILRHEPHYARVVSVTLADSLHAAYADPDARPMLGEARALAASDLDSLAAFARDAAGDGRRRMSVTHSEVYPGTYASTTETADHLLGVLGLRRAPVLRPGPIGMQQLSVAERGGFWLGGYAGNSAPDHLDHLYAVGAALRRSVGDPAP